MLASILVGLVRLGGFLRQHAQSLGGGRLTPVWGGVLALGLLAQGGCSFFTLHPVYPVSCTPVSSQHLTAPLDTSRSIFFGQRSAGQGSPARVTALEAATGKMRWQQDLGTSPLAGSLAVYDHVVYVVGEHDESTSLFAYRASDGALLWRADAFSTEKYPLLQFRFVYSPPLPADGLVYTLVDTHTGTFGVAAFHINTGTLAWIVSITPSSQVFNMQSLAAGGGLLFISVGDTTQGAGARTVALSAKDGSQVWEAPQTGYSPLLAGDALYLQDQQGLHALRASTGRLLWTAPSFKSTGIPRSLSVAGQRLYLRGEEIATDGGEASFLYAVDVRDGSLLWKYQVNPSSLRGDAALEVNGIVYVGDGTALSALRAQDGHLLWQFRREPNISFGTPAALDQVVFTQAHLTAFRYCGGGYDRYEALYAVNAATGALYWRSASNPQAGDPIGDEQTA